jgi:hypothetical protein
MTTETKPTFTRANIRQTLEAVKAQVGRNVQEDHLVRIAGTATIAEFGLISAVLKGLLDAGRTEDEQRAIAALVQLMGVRIQVWQSHLEKLSK